MDSNVNFKIIEQNGFILTNESIKESQEIYFLPYECNSLNKVDYLKIFEKEISENPMLIEIFFDVLRATGLDLESINFDEIPTEEILLSIDGHPKRIHKIFYGSLYWDVTFEKEMKKKIGTFNYVSSGLIFIYFPWQVHEVKYLLPNGNRVLKGFSLMSQNGVKETYFNNPSTIFNRKNN